MAAHYEYNKASMIKAKMPVIILGQLWHLITDGSFLFFYSQVPLPVTEVTPARGLGFENQINSAF